MKTYSDLKPADVVMPRSKTPGAQQLFEDLQQINDEVGAVARVGQAVVGHAIPRYHLLWIGNENIQCLGRPGDATALERRRVAKIITLARMSPENAAETGPHFVGFTIGRVAGAAGLKDFLAAFGIALRVRHAGCQDKRRRRCDRLETHYHAGTSGPGFFV